VNINTMCEVGAGSGVSINYMAGRTLGPAGAAATSAAYVFLHYALLVAYISKAAAIVSEASGLPLLAAAGGFTAAFGGVCYGARPAQMDALNGALVVAVVGSFVVRGEGGGRGAGARGKGKGQGEGERGKEKGEGEGARGRGRRRRGGWRLWSAAHAEDAECTTVAPLLCLLKLLQLLVLLER
jgi:hypothetical protein